METVSSSNRQSNRGSAVLAVLLVATVGIALIGLPIVQGGSVAAEATAQTDHEFDDDGLDAADDIYLSDDGAVLHYEDEAELDDFDLEMDVSEGLAYILIADETQDVDGELEEGSFSAVLDQNGFSGDGSLVADQPDELVDLSVDAAGEVSEDVNEFDATATGTFESEGAASPGDGATTSGTVVTTADRFEASGSASIDAGAGAGGEEESFEFVLEETDAGYTVEVSEARSVSQFEAEQWETEEQAKQTLENQYGSIAEELGGTSDITIEQYAYEADDSDDQFAQDRLELEFTVEYTGIDDGIETTLPEELAADPELDLSQDEAEAIAESITELDVELIEYSTSSNGGSFDTEWDVQFANYDALTLAMLDAFESVDTEGELDDDEIEELRGTIEAQQAADLESTVEWDGTLEQTADETMELDAEMTSDTENWGAYIEELEANDLDTPGDITFSMTIDSDGDDITMEAAYQVTSEDLVNDGIDAWAETIENDPTTTAETEQFAAALSNSDFEVARMDVDINDGTVEFEGGAQFDDMSDVVDSLTESISIDQIATETDDGSTSMYVHVDDLDGVDTGSATRADIEYLDVVGDETTVHEAGEWDEEFPEADTVKMAEYLDVDSQSSSDDGDSIPGFGAGLAAIAGLLTMLVLRYRS